MADLEDYTLPDTAPEPPSQERAPIFVDREPPANAYAEQVLLGSCLLDPQYYSEIAERLTESDFYLDSNRRIFRAIAGLIESGAAVDIATLSTELKRTKELSTVGGVSAIAALTEGLPRKPSITDYVRLILEKSQLRQMIKLFNVAITRAEDQSDTPLAILEDAESSLMEIAQEANSGKLRTIYDSAKDAGGLEPYLKAYTDPELKPGLQTGFADYDAMTGGLHKSELTIIAARPGAGKTAFAMNIAQNIAEDNKKIIAVFSLEMSRLALEQRMMASKAWVDVRKAATGFLGRDDKVKLETALLNLIETKIGRAHV